MPCPDPRFPEVPADHVFARDGRRWLRGGATEGEAFDITNLEVGLWQLRHGIGREAFNAVVTGRNAFVLWDRETESLWRPPTALSVPGTSQSNT